MRAERFSPMAENAIASGEEEGEAEEDVVEKQAETDRDSYRSSERQAPVPGFCFPDQEVRRHSDRLDRKMFFRLQLNQLRKDLIQHEYSG